MSEKLPIENTETIQEPEQLRLFEDIGSKAILLTNPNIQARIDFEAEYFDQ